MAAHASARSLRASLDAVCFCAVPGTRWEGTARGHGGGRQSAPRSEYNHQPTNRTLGDSTRGGFVEGMRTPRAGAPALEERLGKSWSLGELGWTQRWPFPEQAARLT